MVVPLLVVYFLLPLVECYARGNDSPVLTVARWVLFLQPLEFCAPILIMSRRRVPSRKDTETQGYN